VLRVLGRTNSFNVRKVLWLCAELGIPYEREDYGRGFRPTSTPEFLRLNPAAQIPVVIDGDLVMRESNAIIRYLGAKYGATQLYPTDLATRFRVEQWMDWVAYDLTHAMRGAFLGGQLQEAPWNNEWFVQQGRKDFTHCIGLVEAELAQQGGPYILGEAFTLADIPLGLVVNRWFCVQGFAKPVFPAVAAYYETLSQRPAYRLHGRNGMP
jgi:glutathione S-transferase